MHSIFKYATSASAVFFALTTAAQAQMPLSGQLSVNVPVSGGIAGLVAAGVITGVWIARRKR